MAEMVNMAGKTKALLLIASMYLVFFIVLTMISGHLYSLGDATLFFSWWTDALGYKLVADYYTSLGQSERPSDYLLALRPFVFPLYLSLYHIIGVAGLQILQVLMNAASLWLVFLASSTLSKRSWIAAVCTLLLAVTPSFNFLVFHGMTEIFAIFLICLFIKLTVDHFHRGGGLFGAALTVSTLLCVKPILLPFWILFMTSYTWGSLREGIGGLWRPLAALAPVMMQLLITLVLIGTPTLSPSGSVNISSWFFPAVYGEKEYGRFTLHESKEAEEGIRRFPELKEKVEYLVRNYPSAIKTYLYLLVGEHLTAGSNYVRTHTQTDESNKAARSVLHRWSIYLNRFFVCIHALMAVLMIGLLLLGVRIYEQKAMLVCYIFAALLILPAGLTYWQGDRYVLLAAPLWLVAHSALMGQFLNLMKTYSETKPQGEGLVHEPAAGLH